MSVDEVEAPASKKSLPLVAWLASTIGCVVLFAIAWTFAWHFAARESEAIVDAWIAREKAFGRIWSCPDRKTAGFPFAIDIACTKPHFEGVIFGKHFSGGLSGFHATALLVRPSRVTARIASPFAVLSNDRTIDLKLTWADLQIVLDGLPKEIWRVAISGENLTLRATREGFGSLTGKAARLVADAAQQSEQADRSYDFHIAASAASLPLLDRFFGAAQLADIGARGTLTKAGLDPALTLPENLDRWRAAGGRIDFADASITHGETTFKARGSLSLDDAHQVQGKLDTESRGFESLLRRLGVNPMLVNAGALLNSLIGEAPPSGAQAAPQDSLHVAISFDSGRLSIGPAHTSIHLPPLY